MCYTPGQFFPAHYDGCIERPLGHPREGDKTFITATLYLNDVPESHGGATNFLDHGSCSVKHQPEAGSVLLFTQDLYHEGVRLRNGLKYTLRTEVFYGKAPPAPPADVEQPQCAAPSQTASSRLSVTQNHSAVALPRVGKIVKQELQRSRPKVVLTRAQANEMQEELIARFGEADFQNRLRSTLEGAGTDPMLVLKPRMELLLPVQTAVISKYGFDASRKGVAQSVFSVRSLFGDDEELMSRAEFLQTLVNPV